MATSIQQVAKLAKLAPTTSRALAQPTRQHRSTLRQHLHAPQPALLLVLAVLFASLALPGLTTAQERRLCFNVPGITECITGRFLEYWEQNGGLPIFGYPITSATEQATGEGSFLTQFFERNRFEYHPEVRAPYDVLLGRLGDDRLAQIGWTWHTFPRGQATPGCLWFETTGHSLCEPFKSYWENNGLRDTRLSSYAQSLALFGLPLSEPRFEKHGSGDVVITQWFERARFEDHGTKGVLLGLLGNEVQPQPENSTPPPPQPILVSLRSFNAPSRYIRHRDLLGEVTTIETDLDRKDATFRMVPGLADPSLVSFESINFPGYYLRHQDWRLKLNKFEDTNLFKTDATFRRVPGLADKGAVSFEDYGRGRYIRHRDWHLYVEPNDSERARQDATFVITDPLWK